MYRSRSIHRLQRSRVYKALTILLLIAVLGSGVLPPLSSRAATAAPSRRATAAPASPATSSVTQAPTSSTTATTVQQTAAAGDDLIIPDPPKGKVVVSRTAYTRTERAPDGLLTTTFSVRPIHYPDPQTKEWREFRNDLRPVAELSGYSHENTANRFRVSFGKPSDVSLGRPVVRVAAEDASITMTAIGVAPSGSEVGGPSIKYLNAYPLADLNYTVDNERVKESIILKSAPATAGAALFKYDLELGGLSASKEADGSITFNDPSGKGLFRMPKPFMYDSGSVAERQYSDAVQVTLTQLGGGKVRIELLPDLAWLQDPARVYPVTLDPTVDDISYTTPGANDVHIYECCPTNNTAGSTVLYVGMNSSGQRRDTLAKFPELQVLPQDSQITSAYLKMYADSGTDNLPMEIHANVTGWEEATTTWGSMPTDTTMGTAVYGTPNSTVPGWNSMWVTGLTRYWVQGKLTNQGVRIFSKGTANQSVTYDSGDNPDASKRPYLVVNYVPASRYGANQLWTYTSQDHGGGNTSYVNTSNGNVVLVHQGSSIGTRGFSVNLSQTYNSQDPYYQATQDGADYGEGWTFAEALRLYEIDNGNAVIFKDGSGSANRVYAKNTDLNGTRNYQRPLHYGATLTKDLTTGVWTLVTDMGATTLTFDASGKLTRKQDRNGNYLTYAYDAADATGRLTRITDVAGRNTSLEYLGTGGRLSKVTDMAGRVSTYTYSSLGNLKTITHGAGTTDAVTTTFNYNTGNHLLSVVNPRGHTSNIDYRVEYDWETSGSTLGWTSEGAAVVSQSTEQAFSGSGSLAVGVTKVICPLNYPTCSVERAAVHTYSTPVSWNALQQELDAVVRADVGPVSAQLAITDSRGVTHQGPLTDVSTTAWTLLRLPEAHLDPATKISKVSLQISAVAFYSGTVWLDQVMAKGVGASVTDSKSPANTIAKYQFTWDTRTTQVLRPNELGVFKASTYVHGRDGEVNSVTDPLGNKTTYEHDGFLRLNKMTLPGGGGIYNFTYWSDNGDSTSHLKAATAEGTGETGQRGVDLSNGDTRYTLDTLNERKYNTGQAYQAMISNRDPSTGNVLSTQDNTYTAGTSLDGSSFPAGTNLRTTKYEYWVGGLVKRMVPPECEKLADTSEVGCRTEYTYQATNTGYLTQISAPAGKGETNADGTPKRRVTNTTPNADGSVGTITDPKGQKTVYTYDGLGRLKKIEYGMEDGVADSSRAYTLDDSGNMTAMTDNTGSTAWVYDENNRVTSESRTQNAVTKTATYSYYANGLMSSMTTLGGQTVTYHYDDALRLQSESDPKDGNRALTFGYDENSRRTRITYPSGVSHNTSYDGSGRVDLLTLKAGDGTVLQSYDYYYGIDSSGVRQADYNKGNAVKVFELGGTQTLYSYDELNRVTGASRTGTNPYTRSYSYDADNNRLSATRDGTTTTATYDDAQQLTSETTNGVSSDYTHDRNGNLTSYGDLTLTYNAANQWTGGSKGSTSLSLGYDGLGRRVSRSVGGARTDHWYDVTGLTLESGAENTTYLRDTGGKLLSRDRNGYTVNYGTDRQGSVTMLTTDAGAVASELVYDPYGEEVAHTGTDWYNPFRYTGTYFDTSTGLYQMGARYYGAGIGRFTQADPLPRSVYEANRYAYVGDNPVNGTDPTGLSLIVLAPLLVLPTWVIPALLVVGIAAVLTGGFISYYRTRDIDSAAGELGLPSRTVGRAVERLKSENGLSPRTNVTIETETGDVYYGDELLGNVYDEAPYSR